MTLKVWRNSYLIIIYIPLKKKKKKSSKPAFKTARSNSPREIPRLTKENPSGLICQYFMTDFNQRTSCNFCKGSPHRSRHRVMHSIKSFQRTLNSENLLQKTYFMVGIWQPKGWLQSLQTRKCQAAMLSAIHPTLGFSSCNYYQV